ncbi:MAG: hypothetical protein ABL999_17880 [Pyrinomonadaceae bacterium]
MDIDQKFDWRRSDRRLFLLASAFFAIVIFIGFGPTYYFKLLSGSLPAGSILIHTHGSIMTAWVMLFILQVFLIRTKRAKVHMNLGVLGIALAILLVFIGFLTAVAAAKYGSASTPPGIPPLSFLIVPLTDILVFIGLFGAAIYYRKRFADHKRLMLLTVLNFLPPAIARIPIEPVRALGPIVFFGVPVLLAIGLVAYDTWRNRKLNRVFLIGSLILIASYPLRLAVSGTETWIAFAGWLTSWAA